MTTEPLHTHSETHLYGDSFEEFAAGRITEGDEVLVAAPTDEIATSIVDHLRDHIPGLAGQVETYCSDQSDLPFESDSFDVAVHYNPGRGVLQRHVPLYEMTAVVREGGQILYRAPNYVAHSTSASIEELQALGWSDHGDPIVAGRFEVTTSGDPREDTHAERAETTLTDF